MPLFELDDGRPRLVQPMQPLPGSFAQDLQSLLTHHLAAIAGEPLFPVRHRSGAPDHADLPELLALDATGRAVVVEGVQVLDDDAVVTALRHAGAAARMTATDLARSYHADPDRFAVDFAAFRDQVAFGMATSRREGVRLLIVCSEVATEAGDTLSYLRGPGRHVDVLQLGVVRGVDDRRFLDVSPLARHENVRRPVEPTALRLVRSSEASFATAMAYEEGRRRPPAPLGGTVHPGPAYGSGLPSTSAFPSGPSQGASGRSTPPAPQRPTGQATNRPPAPPAGRSTPLPPPPPPRPTTPAPGSPVTPAAAVLPVAGAPSAQVSTSTRAVPAVTHAGQPAAGSHPSATVTRSSASRPPAAPSSAPPSYAPPVNRTTSSYAPPANPAPTNPLLTNPVVPPAPTPGGSGVAYGAPYSSSRPSASPQAPASRTTSTAPMPAAADPRPDRDYPATASPLYESMAGLLAGQVPAVGRAGVMDAHDARAERAYDEPYGRQLGTGYDERAYDERSSDERASDEQAYDERAHDEQAHDEPAHAEYAPTYPAPPADLTAETHPADGLVAAPTLPAPAPRRPDEPYPELATLAKQRRAVVTLVWLRERRGQRLVATLAPDGSIELPDGAQFFDPGEAAAYAAGTPMEVDGWRAWRLGDGGPTLAEAAGRHE
ncbi:restriction system modified-DNA reader domain-containing protein [Cellulomonas persica]|uniref:RAMA domain-containing protein n=1 Tax=Cellulomonas persica TaxID=76861 RepID=A0A510UY87_9CELL|nr:hypothetical protein [Cellulomonas persica]GEK18471.1 hypothetical protein CPE01_22040 [Cellulomonas persica]